MNFQYHTESVSQHVDHFNPIILFKNKIEIIKQAWAELCQAQVRLEVIV